MTVPTQFLAALLCLLLAAPLQAQEEDDLPGENQTLTGDLARRAETAIDEAGDPFQRCVAYHQRGFANARLGRYDQAIADLRQALSLSVKGAKTPDMWCMRWRIGNDLRVVLASSGDHLGEIDTIKAMADEARQQNERREFITQLFLIGPYGHLLMFKEADAAFERATALLPRMRQRKDWTSESDNILNQYNLYAAYLQELRGNLPEGERLRRLSLQHADAYRTLKESTLPAGHQLIRVAKHVQTVATRMLADNLAKQNKLGEAEYYARRALETMLTYSATNTREVSGAMAALAFIKVQQGQLPAAEKLYRQAVQAVEGSDTKPWALQLAGLRSKLAFVLLAQKRWNEADELFRVRDTGLRSNAAQYQKVSGRNIDWALVLVRTGKASEGAEMLNRLLAHRRRASFSDPMEIAQLRGYLGLALTAEGKFDAALTEFRDALPELLKRTSDNAGSDSGGYFRLTRLRTVLEGYLELLANYHAKGNAPAGLDVDAEAFRIADLARGSSVQRALLASVARANLPDPALAELARREQDASSRLQSLSNVLIRLASAPEASRLNQVISDMRSDMQKLEQEQVSLRRELEQRFPDYANLINPQPPTPAALQSALSSNEAMLAFYVAEQRSYVWIIGKQAVSFRVINYPWAETLKDANALRHGLDLADGEVRKFDYATAHQVYRQLLAADVGIWGEAKLLNVIPHGPLAQIPFSVLLSEPAKGTQAAGQAWLMLKTAIAQQPSGSAWLALRQAPGRVANELSFIGFGDPVFAESLNRTAGKIRSLGLLPGNKQNGVNLRSGEAAALSSRLFSLLAPLPDTAIELNEIANTTQADKSRDLFIGKRASEGNVKKADLKRYRVVAFATHGLTPAELPELDQPALALSNPSLSGDSGNDGLLTLEEILALKLDADWVVLSACNTASPDGVGGEAISGLGRGFFFAGARSLLVSNWAVETVSARLLTTSLFRQQAANAQLGRAEALQAAMQTVMRDKSGNYAHPAFWAPFSVVGDGGR